MGESLERLIKILKNYDDVAIAFSGGADSTFLTAMAMAHCHGKVIAITAESEFQAGRDKSQARETAAHMGVEHRIVQVRVMGNTAIVQNPKDRCYHCKTLLLGKVVEHAASLGISVVFHGANCDDLGDFRPGFKAAEELGVFAPLIEAGLNKDDVRRYSKQLGLKTWDLPSQSCLATRIPYDTPITEDVLARIEQGEAFLYGLGLATVRVRYHDRLARIETGSDGFELLASHEMRDAVTRKFKQIGFLHVCLDLGGYVSGSMNADG